MAASAGTLVCVGMKSRRTYNVDVYIPDAAGTLLTFNPSGAAASTSPSTWRAPEDVVITDISTATAPTATGFIFNANGASVNGGSIRWANQLAANPNRIRLALPVRGGDFLGATQFA